MFNVPPDVGLHRFRARLEDQPGFRVGRQDDPPGFRVNSDGSTYASAPNRPGTQSVGYGAYGDAHAVSGLAAALGLDPNSKALDQWLRVNQVDPYPPPQQSAASVNCADGHRACRAAGRSDLDCTRLLWRCSQDGVPTIFAPGVWGKRV